MFCVAHKCTGGPFATITRGSRAPFKCLSGLGRPLVTTRSISVTKQFSEEAFLLPSLSH